MKIKRKGMPLGSGLYEMPQDPAPMALGSGLYGIGIPPAAPLQFTTPSQGWVSAEGGSGYADGQAMDVTPPRGQAKAGGGFDFMELLGDPRFVLGMNLLGASNSPNPWGTALNNTLAAQASLGKGKREQRALELEEQEMLARAQRAAVEAELGRGNLEVNRQNAATGGQRVALDARQLEARMPLWEAQVRQRDADAQAEAQKLEMMRRQLQLEEGLYGAIMNRGQTVPAAPVQGGMVPQGAEAGAGAMGRYGTPAALLDSLARVESSGNPKAVNPRSGAQGMYQFMPGTVEMLANKGMKFDPFDAAQSRDAADFYLQGLLRANGGDYGKALAAYGGFVTKDPTDYVNKVMDGRQPRGGAAVAAPDTRLGVLASMIKPQVGSALMKEAEMEQQRALKEREFGFKERELAQGEAGLGLRTPDAAGLSPADRSQMTAGALGETVKSMEKEHGEKIARIPEQFKNLQTARQALENVGPFIGKGGEVKLDAVKAINNNLGWMGIQLRPEQVKNAEVLRSTMEQQVTSLLKSIDPNPTERQQESLRRALGGLGTDPGALPKLIDIMEDTLRTRAAGFNQRYEQARAAGAPFASDLRVQLPERPEASSAGGEGVMSLDEYLRSKRPERPRRSDTPVSPREAAGRIKFN